MPSRSKASKAMALVGGILVFVAAMVALDARGIGPRAPHAAANHATAPNEITVASSAANTVVPLGTNFVVTLAVTTSTALYKSIQWELAYGSNVSFISDVYTCAQFPSEFETQPAEDSTGSGLPALSPLTILGFGASCASLSAPFLGTTTPGVFVTVTLRCVSNGTSPVFAVDEATHFGNGTVLGDSAGGTIATTLEPQYVTQSHGTRAGFDVICGQASTPTATSTPSPTNTPAVTNTPTISPTPTITSTPTVTSTPCVGAQCPTGPVNALILNQKTCLLVGTALGGGFAIECVSTEVGIFNLNLRNLANRLAKRPLGDPTNPSLADFEGIDLDANQLHEQDGVIFVAVFLDEQAPIDITVSNASIVPISALTPVGSHYRCQTASTATGGDPDCVTGALGGDGAYAFAIRPDVNTVRGAGTITVSQDGHAKEFPFTVVGEAASIAITTLDPSVQTGASDFNGGTATTDDDCRLGMSASAFLTTSGTPERTVAMAVVRDSDGTIITGAGVVWETDDATIAATSTGFTPTIDLGPLGVGAPEILCGTLSPGTTTIRARTVAIGPAGPVPAGFPIDPAAPDLRTSKEITVTGIPSSMVLSAVPPEVACDGAATSAITAAVADANGAAVADGNGVHFDVVAFGVVTPINTLTIGGSASALFRGLASFTVGVPVAVTVGGVQSSILVRCVGFDTDGDGIANASDNCPQIRNANQLNTDAGNNAVNRPGADALGDACDDDSDGDGYTAAQEAAVVPAKSDTAYCDIMRADVDSDGAVTILDMTVLAQHFLEPVTPATERYNQDADNAITILDLTKMANLFFDNVSACP